MNSCDDECGQRWTTLGEICLLLRVHKDHLNGSCWDKEEDSQLSFPSIFTILMVKNNKKEQTNRHTQQHKKKQRDYNTQQQKKEQRDHNTQQHKKEQRDQQTQQHKKEQTNSHPLSHIMLFQRDEPAAAAYDQMVTSEATHHTRLL